MRGDLPGWPDILLAIESCGIGNGLNCPDAAAVAMAAACWCDMPYCGGIPAAGTVYCGYAIG